MKTKKRKRKFIAVLIVLVALLTGGVVVYADEINEFLDWSGKTKLEEVEEITEIMSEQINDLGEEVDLLQLEIIDLEEEIELLELEDEVNLLIIEELEQDIIDLNLIIDGLNLTILGLEEDLQDIIDERDWLLAELTEANTDATQFKDDICTIVDTINSPSKRAEYDDLCGVRE